MGKKMEFCAWAGQLAMTIMFLSVWPAAHIFPPPAPSDPGFVKHFADNATGMLVAGTLMQLAAAIFCVFMGGLVECLRKMEGNFQPYTTSVLILIPFGFAPLLLMAINFTEIGFRPDVHPDTIQMLADLAIFYLVFPVFVGLVQFVITGMIILGDINSSPIFPRWTGYFNIWIGILSLGGALVGFFKGGPFAWHGIFGFWMPVVLFGVLINVMFWAMRKGKNHAAFQN